MWFILMMKADRNSEAGVTPSGRRLTKIGRFDEGRVLADVMQSGEALVDSSAQFTR